MRNRSPHAAGGGRVPLALRGSKPARTVIAAAVAGAIAFVPAVMFASPAVASPPVYVAVTSPSAVEGSDLTFTVSYSGTGAATYSVAVSDGTATAGTDYTAPSASSITFAATGAPAQTVTVHTTDDQLYENNETVNVTLTNLAAGSDSAMGTGTIVDNDTAPSYTLSTSPNPVAEANSLVPITATLSAPSGKTTTINLSTTDGTAKAGVNYGASITPIVIAPGALSGHQPVSILDDGEHDATSPMNFTVTGIGTNVTGTAQSLQIGITDAQPVPKVTITGPSATAEAQSAVFTVQTDTLSALPITVNWDALPTTAAAGDGVATPGDDFTYPSSGRTVTIPAGQPSVALTIPITNDGLNELVEDYTIGISSPVNATLATTTKAVSTITDVNTPPPTVSIAPTTVIEGDSGTRAQTFTATLSAPSGRTVTVDWATTDVTALQGYDYVATSGELTFPAGTTSQTFTIGIIGDKIYENPSEQFNIRLTRAAADTQSVSFFNVSSNNIVTITDDDPMPTATVADISVKEGDVTAPVLVPIKLSNPTSAAVVVTLTDTPVTNVYMNNATSNQPGANDYTLASTSVTIPPGQLTGYAVVLVNGDTMYEPDEVTNLGWSATNVATPITGTASFTILNDDKAPNLEVNSIAGHEGDTVAVTGTVTGWSQTDTYLTVTFTGTSVNGKKGATADDFVNPGGSPVTIYAGTAPGVVLPIANMKLNTDTSDEPDETILASGIGTNNVGTVTDGAITILGHGGSTPPSDTAPTISAPANIIGGGTVTVTGKAPAGATVDIWGGPWSTAMPALIKIGSATAGSNGSYSLDRWIGSGYRFQAAVGDMTSAEVKTSITQLPVFVVSSPAKGMVTLAVQGNPRAPKQAVIIQRWTGGKWVNTWSGTTGTDYLWRASAKEPSKSAWTLRAWVAGIASMGLNPGYSVTRTVTVK